MADIKQVQVGSTTYDIKDAAARADIADIKSAMSFEEAGIKEFVQDDIIQGSYNSRGEVTTATNRIRVNGFLRVYKGEKIIFTPGTNIGQILYGRFDESKTYKNESSWLSGGTINIDWDGYTIIVWRKSSGNENITPSDYDATTVLMSKTKGEYRELAGDLKTTEQSVLKILGTSSFTKASGSVHSAIYDKVTGLSIASGEKFCIMYSRPTSNWVYFYGYDSNGTQLESNILSTNQSAGFAVITAASGIASIGWADSSTSTSGEYTFTVIAYESVFSEAYEALANSMQNASKIAALEANKPITDRVVLSPTLSNGSGPNTGNLNGVTARAVPFAYGSTKITVINNRPVGASGNYYLYDISAFKGSTWYTNRITNAVAVNGEVSFEPDTVINNVSGVDGFGVTIWEYNSEGTIQQLRIADFADYPIIVRYLYDSDILTHREIKNDEAEHKVLNARHVKNDTGSALTLLHFSDLHSDTAALARIMGEAKTLTIDDAICTGDMVANTAEQIASWWDKTVMTCIGNHDTASYSGTTYDWTALSMANRDAYYIAPFESEWGITHTAGTSYYYKDYTTQKVRLIVMDVMLYNDNGADAVAQTSWLNDLLASAITGELHVLIAIHAPHGGAPAKECSFSRYNQTNMSVNTDCNTPQDVIDAVSAKIEDGLKFVGYLVGHTHQDNIWDAENDGEQLMYCVTCAAQASRAQWKASDQDRTNGTDAYNIVTIDTTNTLVKIVRGGGADIDDHMRTRRAICFNYTTGEIVGEVN